jgi:membrane protein
METHKTKTSLFSLPARWRKASSVLARELWTVEKECSGKLRNQCFRLLRILILAWQGQKRNQLPIQSAALTFYSMIGIGPLVAFSIMISGFLLDKDMGGQDNGVEESVVVETITKAITFAAPHVALGNGEATDDSGEAPIAPEVLELIQNFSAQAKSGTVGIVGSLMLLVIGIQVLTSIEKSFNTVWGVSKGRKLPERIVTYWTFISLGAVLGTAALSLLTANAILSAMETLPFGETLAALFQFSLPLFAFLVFTLALAIFYRFIPNTEVRWKPALIGGALVTAGLNAYQMLSFLYVQRVVDTKSLYGSVGILIVLMLGLYIFWLLVLYGGQITYAIQNADHLTNENAWQRTSQRAREAISLGVLILVARRFQAGESALSGPELQRLLRVPFHILNSSINHLCELGYLSPIHHTAGPESKVRSFQPGKPLEAITMSGFKKACDNFGNNEGIELIAHEIPAVNSYLKEADHLNQGSETGQSLFDILRNENCSASTSPEARD